ncbi:MAG: glycosyltransferase family 4 protein [Bacteroidetes bacterium]|nr:glycosyltransferase family 4 protein [Bacteroidota bacterium]
MKKRVWLINQYALPPKYESRLRTIKFAHYLNMAGYDVTIFASSVMHNFNKNIIEDKSNFVEKVYDDLKFVHVYAPSYGESKIKRIYSSFYFSFNLLKISKKISNPDIIIQTATVPFGNILYYLAKKKKSQYIVEVLDLWPESFAEVGMLNRNNPIMKIAYFLERWLYKKADNLVFSMEGGKQYIIDKGWDKKGIDLSKICYLNNGVDLKDFNFHKSKWILEDNVLKEPNIKRVIYVGSIRLANNVKMLIDAAENLKEHRNIKFLIYGDGSEREKLEIYCKKNNIENVSFRQKWVDPQYIPYILSQSSVNILNYKPQGFGHYGGSQSKMFQYMASGKPICCNIRMMYCPINKYNLGIAKEFKSSKEYSDAIFHLLSLTSDEYQTIKDNNIKTAEFFDYKKLTQKLVALFK